MAGRNKHGGDFGIVVMNDTQRTDLAREIADYFAMDARSLEHLRPRKATLVAAADDDLINIAQILRKAI